jgi:hypothetical protein
MVDYMLAVRIRFVRGFLADSIACKDGTRHTVLTGGRHTVTVDTELGPVEPASEEPKQPGNPGKKWMIFVGCLVVVFVSLGTYDIVSGGVVSGGVGPGADTAASGPTSPAATHPAVASTSAASLSPAAPIAASPIAVAPAASQPGLFPSPAASLTPRSLAVSAIAAFGPQAMSDGDDPGFASRALDDGAQPWYSSWYLTSEFGNLQTGTGLLLDMGKTVTVSSVQLKLGGQPGAAVQVRVGNTAVLDDMFIVSTATDIGGTVRLPTEVEASGRYVLIWFTALPSIGQGKYQVSVYNATVDGTLGA